MNRCVLVLAYTVGAAVTLSSPPYFFCAEPPNIMALGLKAWSCHELPYGNQSDMPTLISLKYQRNRASSASIVWIPGHWYNEIWSEGWAQPRTPFSVHLIPRQMRQRNGYGCQIWREALTNRQRGINLLHLSKLVRSKCWRTLRE